MTVEIAKAPLPSYSAPVTQSLTEGTPENVWTMLVAETSGYYFRQWPSISDSSTYRMIGQRIYDKFPSIKQEGAHPWVRTWNTAKYRQNLTAYQ